MIGFAAVNVHPQNIDQVQAVNWLLQHFEYIPFKACVLEDSVETDSRHKLRNRIADLIVFLDCDVARDKAAELLKLWDIPEGAAVKFYPSDFPYGEWPWPR